MKFCELVKHFFCIQVVSRKLDPGIPVPIFSYKRDAVTNTSPISSEVGLRAGECLPIFLGPLPDEKLPKDAMPGDVSQPCPLLVCSR
jgi:hypothetical protein